MFTVSDRWASAISGSHRMITRVDVLSGGNTILTLDTVIEGSVEVERTLIRRQASLTVIDPGDGSLIATAHDHPLTVFGNELRIWRGLVYNDGTEELVPVFTGPINEVEEDYPQISLSAMDRADLVQRHRFERPLVIAKGSTYLTAIQRVLNEAVTGLEFNFPESSAVTPQLVFEEQGDPWEAAKKMAASLGNELLFDAMGTCVMQPEPDPTVLVPMATFVEGSNAEFPELAAQAVLLAATRARTNRSRYNKVIVTGENPDNDAVYRGEAWDADPSSPTYVGGDYGVVPRWYASPFITSNSQAATAARSVLRSELGQTDQIPFQIIPNPALDVGDVVRVIRERAGIDTQRSVDKLTVPLTAEGTMDVTTRALVAVEDEAG